MVAVLVLAVAGPVSADAPPAGAVTAKFFTSTILRGVPFALRQKGYPEDVAAKQMECVEKAVPRDITPVLMAFLESRFTADELRQVDAFFGSPAGLKLIRIIEVNVHRKYGDTSEELPQLTAEEQAAMDTFAQSPAGLKFASPEIQGAARPGTEVDRKAGEVMRQCQAAIG